MKKVNIDGQAMRFSNSKYCVNVFWYDVIGHRGFRFFLHQLTKGCRLLIYDNPASESTFYTNK